MQQNTGVAVDCIAHIVDINLKKVIVVTNIDIVIMMATKIIYTADVIMTCFKKYNLFMASLRTIKHIAKIMKMVSLDLHTSFHNFHKYLY